MTTFRRSQSGIHTASVLYLPERSSDQYIDCSAAKPCRPLQGDRSNSPPAPRNHSDLTADANRSIRGAVVLSRDAKKLSRRVIHPAAMILPSFGRQRNEPVFPAEEIGGDLPPMLTCHRDFLAVVPIYASRSRQCRPRCAHALSYRRLQSQTWKVLAAKKSVAKEAAAKWHR